MKKSKCYRLAQMAVLTNDTLLPSEKLDILRVLMDEETVHKICEKQTEEKESEGK